MKELDEKGIDALTALNRMVPYPTDYDCVRGFIKTAKCVRINCAEKDEKLKRLEKEINDLKKGVFVYSPNAAVSVSTYRIEDQCGNVISVGPFKSASDPVDFDFFKESSELDCENHQLNNEILELKDEIAELKKQIPPKYDPEKEYAKGELQECMQAACDLMNRFDFVFEIAQNPHHNKMSLQLHVDDHVSFSDTIKYHGPLRVPARNRIVLVNGGEFVYSCGFFADDWSGLAVFSRNSNGEGFILETDIWCDFFDRSHHSPGWKREFEPDYEKEGE